MKKRDYTTMNLPATLLAIFITLKLTDNIDWSWWWVLAPIWVPISIVLVGVFVYGVLYYSVGASTRRKIRGIAETFMKDNN